MASLGRSPDLEDVARFFAGAAVPAADFPWQALERRDVQVARHWANETFPPLRAARVLRSLRTALRQAEPRADVERAMWLAARRLSRGGKSESRGRPLLGRDVRALFAACEADARPAGRRDAAIIALILLAGVRPSEAATLHRADFDDESFVLRIRSAGRLRFVAFDGPCRLLLEDWLAVGGSGALFKALDRRGDVTGRGLTPSAINRLVGLRCRQGLVGHLTPCDLRRAFREEVRRRARLPYASSGRYYRPDDGEPGWLIECLAYEPRVGRRHAAAS
jgi:integrase/recombinase XerD